MKTKHTPGPWHTNNRNVDGPKGQQITFCPQHVTSQTTLEEAEANARLIAAAPDLLAALVAVVAAVDWMNKHALPAQAKAVNSTFDWNAARAALAKASAEG